MAGGGTRWTPRARRLAASVFLLFALVALAAGIVGAICDEPSLECVRNEGRDAVRIAVVSVPFIAYAAYRFTRGPRGRGD